MMLWHIFLAFFISNLLGYGGGPASIPLMKNEIVDRYGWLTNAEFANVLAVGNALPGPIATKIAAFVGYENGGILGAAVALTAAVVPSAVALIVFLQLINRFKTSSAVRGMTLLIQPVIAVMMILLTWNIGKESIMSVGGWQFLIIALVSYLALTKMKIHPAVVIVFAFGYGGIVLPYFME